MKKWASKHTVKRSGIYKGIPVVAKIDLELVWLEGNRLPYFSVTGKIVKMDKNGNMSRFKKDEIVFGAIGDEIKEITDEFNDIIRLHLHYMDGKPMHLVANGWYYCKQGKAEELAKHLMIDIDWANKLIKKCHSEAEFELEMRNFDLFYHFSTKAFKVKEKYKLIQPESYTDYTINYDPESYD